MLDRFLRFVFYEVPFVDHNHKALLVALDEREDGDVLRLDAACGVDHQYADIRSLDGADRTDNRIIFDIFCNLGLFTDTGCVDEVEIEAEFIVARIDRVACGAGDVGHDVAVFVNKRIDD